MVELIRKKIFSGSENFCDFFVSARIIITKMKTEQYFGELMVLTQEQRRCEWNSKLSLVVGPGSPIIHKPTELPLGGDGSQRRDCLLMKKSLERNITTSRKNDICDQVEEIVTMALNPDFFDVGPSDKSMAESHLRRCKKCREYYSFIVGQRALADAATRLEVKPGAISPGKRGAILRKHDYKGGG